MTIAVLSLIPVILLTEAPCGREEKRKAAIGELVASHFSTSFQILRSDVRILKIIIFYSVVFASQTLLFFYSQQYYFEHGYNKIRISLILLVMSGASCLGAVLSDRLYHRYKKKIVSVGTMVIAAAFLCYSLENMAVSILAFSAAGFFNSALYPVQSDSLNQLIPSEQRATLISVSSMFFSVAMILMFPLAGMAADHLGLTRVFVFIGAAVLVFAMLSCLGSRRDRGSYDGENAG